MRDFSEWVNEKTQKSNKYSRPYLTTAPEYDKMSLQRTEYYGEDCRAARPLGGIAMKKITKALIAIILLSALLTGCAKSDPETPADSTTATAELSGTTNLVWDGSVASGFSGGSGTAEDPYRIRSAA